LVTTPKFKNMKTTKFITLSAAGLLIGLSSCRKEQLDNDTNAAKYESSVELYFNETNDIADQVAKTGSTGLRLAEADGLMSDCATITFDTSANASATNPDTIVIDFGTGCVGNDGKTRAGKLIVSKTGPYFSTGTIITITPDGYSVNGNILSGFRRLTNAGNNEQGQPVFNVEVSASVTLASNGGVVNWSANRTRTWLEGFNTPGVFADDVFSITGSSNGTKVNGDTWSSVITTALTFKRACRQFVSGTRTVTPSNRPERLIDYGNGTCDNTATVTINGNTYTITVN
jgi:hypothetical protein